MGLREIAASALTLGALTLIACTQGAGQGPPPDEATSAPSPTASIRAPLLGQGAGDSSTPASRSGQSDATPVTPSLDPPPLADTLVEPILTTGPDAVVELTSTYSAPCSLHGSLLAPCDEQGKGVYDTFEAIAVSDLLMCEACGVTPEHVHMAITELFTQGGVPVSGFWGDWGPLPRNLAVGGLRLESVWALTPGTTRLIEDRWPGLSADLVFEFVSLTPLPGDMATGFLLYVDPEAIRPISVISPLTQTWRAEDAARELGTWERLWPGQ